MLRGTYLPLTSRFLRLTSACDSIVPLWGVSKTCEGQAHPLFIELLRHSDYDAPVAPLIGSAQIRADTTLSPEVVVIAGQPTGAIDPHDNRLNTVWLLFECGLEPR